MIKVISKGIYFDDKIEEAKRIYEILVQESRKEKGCIAYDLFQDINDKSILTMIEEWENINALNYHRETKHFKTLVPKLSTLRKNSELNIYELILQNY